MLLHGFAISSDSYNLSTPATNLRNLSVKLNKTRQIRRTVHPLPVTLFTKREMQNSLSETILPCIYFDSAG